MKDRQHAMQDKSDCFKGKPKKHAKSAKYGKGLQSQGETSTSRGKGRT